MMKETKAQRIFRATRFECKCKIERRGFEINPNGKAVGFSSLATDESTCTRTLNEIQKLIDEQIYIVNASCRYGIYNEEEAQQRLNVLAMVQSTLDNHRANA